MNKPPREVTIEALLVAAEQAANTTSADHPEDIAYAMSAAIENAWAAVESVWGHTTVKPSGARPHYQVDVDGAVTQNVPPL